MANINRTNGSENVSSSVCQFLLLEVQIGSITLALYAKVEDVFYDPAIVLLCIFLRKSGVGDVCTCVPGNMFITVSNIHVH